MKLKAVVFMIGSLAVSLLGPSELFSGSSGQIHAINANVLKAPLYLTDVPPGHFAGVSAPSKSLAEARKSAIGDIVRQILGAINMNYNHHYVDEVSGNVRNPQRLIDDRLSGNAQGIVLDVERSVVKSSWLTDPSGKYVYFALVHYPKKKIEEMRRISKGARVIATVLFDTTNNDISLKVSEVNGVEIAITSVDISVHKHNRFSNVISFFIFKVPSMVEYKSSISIVPVKVCNNSANFLLPISDFRKSLTDYLLHSYFALTVTLNGYDELGRGTRIKIKKVLPK